MKVKDRKDYFKIIDFINAREIDSGDEEIFMIRKRRFIVNLKVLLVIFSFGWVTVFFYCIFVTPLTDSQRAIEFSDSQMYLFYLMYVQTFTSTIVSSGLAMAANMLLFTLVNFVSLEFRIFAFSFEKLLNKIDAEMTESEAVEVVGEVKNAIKYYQRLLG